MDQLPFTVNQNSAEIQLGQNPTILLKEDGVLRFLVVNGFVYNWSQISIQLDQQITALALNNK